MKFIKLFSTILILSCVTFISCKQKEEVTIKEQILEEDLNKIHQLGFSTQNIQRVDEGYLVEGDIVLSKAELNSIPDRQFLRVGTEEQYRTNNLVVALPRQITVSISDRLPASYIAALDEALERYNSENLQVSFRRVSAKGAIDVVRGTGSYLASAGFPSNGNPYYRVKVNSNYIGSNPNRSYLATILAHEIGHCIGFRHTDYKNRAFSCGGQATNEGASTVGAIHIPGTPTSADPNSWMLACIGTGQNRPFNANDKTALQYLY